MPDTMTVTSIGEHVLKVMRDNWSHIGADLPRREDGGYCAEDAIEVAINELLDTARSLGFTPTHQGEEIGRMGVQIDAD